MTRVVLENKIHEHHEVRMKLSFLMGLFLSSNLFRFVYVFLRIFLFALISVTESATSCLDGLSVETNLVVNPA
jgi:hypothetical protein